MAGPLLLAVEIGGTKLQVAIGRGDGRLLGLERRSVRPEAGASGILAQIVEAADALTVRFPGESRPEAVGIGFGGPVDADRGVVVRSHQIEGWDGFPLADWARSNLRISHVSVQNDADAAGLGEARFGAGVGFDPVFYVTVGSGIGGGLIVDGAIYRGSGAGAAEIGHLWVDGGPEGPRTVESIASGWSIGRAAGPWLVGSPVDAAAVARAAKAGDTRALEILGRATDALGRALAHVGTLVGPRRIILGGGVSLIDEGHWLDPIRRRFEERVFPPFRGTCDLTSAALGEAVVLHGGLAMARDRIEAS